MDAVHRLNGSGCDYKSCLRYSRSYRESGLADEDFHLSIIFDASLELLGGF